MSSEASASSAWEWEHERGSAAFLHEWRPPASAVLTGRLLSVDRAALVLGSSQAEESVDGDAIAALGFDLTRRRSGGGGVVLIPGEHLWIDLWLPAGHVLWSDDVVGASGWVGDLWRVALSDVGVDDAVVHRGPLVSTPWSALVCFAGLGPGEVTVGSSKLVGLSQRRTREWARFQCIVHHQWSESVVQSLVRRDHRPGDAALPSVAIVDEEGLVAALQTQLSELLQQ